MIWNSSAIVVEIWFKGIIYNLSVFITTFVWKSFTLVHAVRKSIWRSIHSHKVSEASSEFWKENQQMSLISHDNVAFLLKKDSFLRTFTVNPLTNIFILLQKSSHSDSTKNIFSLNFVSERAEHAQQVGDITRSK